eukprot:5313681-Amphidinium_carterae.1
MTFSIFVGDFGGSSWSGDAQNGRWRLEQLNSPGFGLSWQSYRYELFLRLVAGALSSVASVVKMPP